MPKPRILHNVRQVISLMGTLSILNEKEPLRQDNNAATINPLMPPGDLRELSTQNKWKKKARNHFIIGNTTYMK